MKKQKLTSDTMSEVNKLNNKPRKIVRKYKTKTNEQLTNTAGKCQLLVETKWVNVNILNHF